MNYKNIINDFNLKSTIFNDKVLKGNLRLVALNFMPENLDVNYWLTRNDRDIHIDVIKYVISETDDLYNIEYYFSEYERLGAKEFFTQYEQFQKSLTFMVNETFYIKKCLRAMLN